VVGVFSGAFPFSQTDFGRCLKYWSSRTAHHSYVRVPVFEPSPEKGSAHQIATSMRNQTNRAVREWSKRTPPDKPEDARGQTSSKTSPQGGYGWVKQYRSSFFGRKALHRTGLASGVMMHEKKMEQRPALKSSGAGKVRRSGREGKGRPKRFENPSRTLGF